MVTSSTRWPISHTQRPSLRLSRYSSPRRMGIFSPLVAFQRCWSTRQRSVPGAVDWLNRTPARAWPLLPRRTVGNGLPYRRIHFLRSNQYDGLKLHRPCSVKRQGERGGGHPIRHVGNDEKIVAAIGIIKGFEGAPRACTDCATVSRRFVPPSRRTPRSPSTV